MATLPGARIRNNTVFGTTTDNPLTAGAITLNSTGLANLVAITSDHATITLDPLRQYGNPEIVMVTAHTASSTVATIQRGMYGTTARSHPEGTLWGHAAINEDFTSVVTSLTRPADPYIGQMIFETDTILFKYWNGSSWASIGSGSGGSGLTLGYAQVTASQGSITSEVDLSGLSVTVTVPAGRRLKITGFGEFTSSGVNSTVLMRLAEGATALTEYQAFQGSAGNGFNTAPEVIITPTAGSHTYKLRALMSGGTGTLLATPTVPAFILVEDITGSDTPFANQSLPVGTLAQAFQSSNLGAFSAETDVPGCSVNVAVQAGRILKIVGHSAISSPTVANDEWSLWLSEDGVHKQVSTRRNPNVGDFMEFEVEHILTPSAGSHTYKLSFQRTVGTGTATTNGTASDRQGYIYVEDITATPTTSSGAPGSTLAYAQVTLDQPSITSEVDLTGLAVTVTVPDGRRLKITGHAGAFNNTNDGGFIMRIKEGATNLNRNIEYSPTAANGFTCEAQAIITPTGGTHTYKLTGERAVVGTAEMEASTSLPAYILVEDITGAVWPTGASVTSGLIASEAWLGWTPSVIQGVSVTSTVLTARYIKMGRVVHCYQRVNITGAGTAGQSVTVSLPVPAFAHGGNGIPAGSGWLYDASANQMYAGSWSMLGAGLTVDFTTDNTAGNDWGVVPSIGLANGDVISFHLTYEAAS